MHQPVQLTNNRPRRTRNRDNANSPLTERSKRQKTPVFIPDHSSESSDISDDIPLIESSRNAQLEDVSFEESSLDSSSDEHPKGQNDNWAPPNRTVPSPQPPKNDNTPKPQRTTPKRTGKRVRRQNPIIQSQPISNEDKRTPDPVPRARRSSYNRTNDSSGSNSINEDDFVTNDDSEKQFIDSGVGSAPNPVIEQHESTEQTVQTEQTVETPAADTGNKRNLDISGTKLVEILRRKSVFAPVSFSLYQLDKTIFFTRHGKIALGKGFFILRKNAMDGEMVGFLREHQNLHRFTYYSGHDESSLGEQFGFSFIKRPNIQSQVRQIRVIYRKGFQLHYPKDKSENLSRLARDYNEESPNPIYNDYEILNSQIPRLLQDGTLVMSFGGATCNSSCKNFVFRIPGTNKCQFMCFRQAQETFKARYQDPFTEESAFAMAIASFVGEG